MNSFSDCNRFNSFNIATLNIKFTKGCRCFFWQTASIVSAVHSVLKVGCWRVQKLKFRLVGIFFCRFVSKTGIGFLFCSETYRGMHINYCPPPSINSFPFVSVVAVDVNVVSVVSVADIVVVARAFSKLHLSNWPWWIIAT